MPEIAALAGLQRLDMMLNDSMYGILFRDINPIRTFVDQRFSRQVHARAGIIINTGEDNYLTTADAVEAAHTVTVSQLLNEYFAKEAGLEDWQLGLGHAFEIDPDVPDSFRLELAHAMLARELFPDAPLKWMPPTRHMTGDIFKGFLLDGFFNLVGALTGPGHPARRDDDRGRGHALDLRPRPGPAERPLRHERRRQPARGLPPAPDGFIANRAREVLGESIDLLQQIKDDTDTAGDPPLLAAIADGTFGLMKRPADKGRGLEGVARKARDYYNPASEILEGE
jgi:beta-lysine 5,6-aminomutase alpha subunit